MEKESKAHSETGGPFLLNGFPDIPFTIATIATINLQKEKFNKEWSRGASCFPTGIKAVESFILAHYLHKKPAIINLCLGMTVNEYLCGCVVFSCPPKETEKRFGGKTWELSRLYLLDYIPKNAETWFIGKAVKYIKTHHKDVSFLVSYADPGSGHSGTIYRAANWKFDGMTDAGRKTPRSDYVDVRTGKKYGRAGNVPQDAVIKRVPRVSKYRFMLEL